MDKYEEMNYIKYQKNLTTKCLQLLRKIKSGCYIDCCKSLGNYQKIQKQCPKIQEICVFSQKIANTQSNDIPRIKYFYSLQIDKHPFFHLKQLNMENQINDEQNFFQERFFQNNYANLEYYAEYCSGNIIPMSLRDDQFLLDPQYLLAPNSEKSSDIFPSTVQTCRQLHLSPSIDKFSESSSVSQPFYEQYSLHDTHVEIDQEIFPQINHSFQQTAVINTEGSLPEENQIIKNPLTTNPKGYIIYQGFKQAIKSELWKSKLLEICEQEGFDSRELIKLCHKIVSKKKRKQYSYYGFKHFHDMISNNRRIDVVGRKYFIEYLQSYTPVRAKDKALYLRYARQLGQAVLQIQNSFLNGRVQYPI